MLNNKSNVQSQRRQKHLFVDTDLPATTVDEALQPHESPLSSVSLMSKRNYLLESGHYDHMDHEQETELLKQELRIDWLRLTRGRETVDFNEFKEILMQVDQ